LEKKFNAPLIFQWKTVTRERHPPKFCLGCYAWKSPRHARYVVDICHVFQSGWYAYCYTLSLCVNCWIVHKGQGPRRNFVQDFRSVMEKIFVLLI